MATFETTFADETVGVIPAGWERKREGTMNAVPSWKVQERPGTRGGKCLVFDNEGATQGTLRESPYVIAWTDIGLGGTVLDEILVKFLIKQTSITTNTGVSVHLRAGNTDYEGGYMANIYENSDSAGWTLGIYYENPNVTNMASIGTNTGKLYETQDLLNTDFWMRFRVEGTGAGTLLKAKVWRDSEDEPAAWTIERTNLASGQLVDSPGYAGIGGEALFPDEVRHDVVGVGVGEAAVEPIFRTIVCPQITSRSVTYSDGTVHISATLDQPYGLIAIVTKADGTPLAYRENFVYSGVHSFEIGVPEGAGEIKVHLETSGGTA